jgi:hypothetical protein
MLHAVHKFVLMICDFLHNCDYNSQNNVNTVMELHDQLKVGIGLGAFAASELDVVFSGYQSR